MGSYLQDVFTKESYFTTILSLGKGTDRGGGQFSGGQGESTLRGPSNLLNLSSVLKKVLLGAPSVHSNEAELRERATHSDTVRNQQPTRRRLAVYNITKLTNVVESSGDQCRAVQSSTAVTL